MPRFNSRTIGAALAVAIVGLIGTPLWLVTFGPTLPSLDEALPLLGSLALFAILGWWAGRAAATGDWGQAIVTGLGLGVGWYPAAISVGVIASVFGAVFRGGPIGSLEPELFLWGLSILAIFVVPAALIGVPNGLAWAIATRWSATRSGGLEGEPTHRHPSLIAMGALLVLAIATGTALALTAPIGR